MRKLKHKDIPDYRNKLLREQKGIDPISGLKITDPVLDHEHQDGHIRSTLQRETNAFEGVVIRGFKRYCKNLGVPVDRLLLGLIEYWRGDYSHHPIHPKHRTPSDRRVQDLRRRMKRAKRRSTKARIRKQIEDIEKMSDR